MSISSKIIKFPYRYKRIKFGQIVNPLISLPILTNAGWEKIHFLVDSGADTTTLPLRMSDHLKCEVDLNKKTSISGIEAFGITGFPGKITLKLGTQKLDARCYFINSNVIPLLGRLDVWDKFSIVFDNIKKEVILKSISNE